MQKEKEGKKKKTNNQNLKKSKGEKSNLQVTYIFYIPVSYQSG